MNQFTRSAAGLPGIGFSAEKIRSLQESHLERELQPGFRQPAVSFSRSNGFCIACALASGCVYSVLRSNLSASTAAQTLLNAISLLILRITLSDLRG